MVRESLKEWLYGDSSSAQEQFEVIVKELTDSPDKVFVWQIPGLTEDELDLLWEKELADVLSHGMDSQHVVVNEEIEVDELVLRDGNTIAVRDDIYRAIEEEE